VSKVLAATCDAAGKVTVDGVLVPGAIVTSEGHATSSGILIIDEGNAWYIPSSASDVKASIEKTIDALTNIASVLNTIATTLTAIGAGMTGPTTAPPPTLPVNVTAIGTTVTSLNAIKTELLTLKGALI
jgi:hypothetical protein